MAEGCVAKNINPKSYTDHDLLIMIVPDFEAIKKERPEAYEKIRKRAVETKEGWRPLNEVDSYGLLKDLVPDIKDLLTTLKRERPAINAEIRRRMLRPKIGWQPLDFLRALVNIK